MAFGSNNEIQEGGNRKFFTGVENFKVVAVNPSKEELEALYGREINYEPEYIGTQNVSDGDGEREVPQVRLDFFLDNGDAENPITTKVSFYVMNTHHKSTTGKYKVINSFGKSTWLTEEDLRGKTVPGNMNWYDTTGLKAAKRGEEEVVDFIANLLNLPWDLTKVADPSDAYAEIEKEQWEQIFKGNFTYLKEIIESTNNKVGLAMGVKVGEDQSMRQVIFNRKSLRQYTKSSNKANKFQWLDKAVQEAKANGAYGTTNFGPSDYSIREFSITPSQLTIENLPEETDVFATAPAAAPVGDDDDWLA